MPQSPIWEYAPAVLYAVAPSVPSECTLCLARACWLLPSVLTRARVTSDADMYAVFFMLSPLVFSIQATTCRHFPPACFDLLEYAGERCHGIRQVGDDDDAASVDDCFHCVSPCSGQ